MTQLADGALAIDNSWLYLIATNGDFFSSEYYPPTPGITSSMRSLTSTLPLRACWTWRRRATWVPGPFPYASTPAEARARLPPPDPARTRPCPHSSPPEDHDSHYSSTAFRPSTSSSGGLRVYLRLWASGPSDPRYPPVSTIQGCGSRTGTWSGLAHRRRITSPART